MRQQQKSSKIGGLFRLIWKTLSYTPIVVFTLVFWFFFVVVISAILQSAPEPITENAPLYIAPSGILVDQKSYRSPSQELFNLENDRPTETLTRELIETIDHAAGDERVSAIVMRLDYLSGGGMSKLDEVGQALERFKQAGKPVIAYADSYSQHQYYLASYADEVYMNDMGALLINGFGYYNSYHKDALDKLSINFHVFKVGKFKDFVEPFTRNSMSESSREHNSQWVNEMWQHYTSTVESHRGLSDGHINQFIATVGAQLEQHNANAAELAKSAGFIDTYGSRIEIRSKLIDRFGSTRKDKNLFKHINYGHYRQLNFSPLEVKKANIGLLVARGGISDGSQPEGKIGGDSFSALIRKAAKDKDLKALVIRVDSGGGSAFASEQIRNEINNVRESGKPVFVSMGSVAASGGYWISTAADEIWATPTTITGSIGVFGLLPTIDQSLKRLGIHNDGFSTTELGEGVRVDRPLNPKIGELIQQSVEGTYQRFLTIVAQARDMTTEEVHEIAQGRVWSSQQAKNLGLVDNVGNLNEVVAAAAKHVNIESPKIKLIKRDLTPQEQLLKMLAGEVSVIMDTAFQESHIGKEYHNLSFFLAPFSEMLKPLAAVNTNEVQALCLECAQF